MWEKCSGFATDSTLCWAINKDVTDQVKLAWPAGTVGQVQGLCFEECGLKSVQCTVQPFEFNQ